MTRRGIRSRGVSRRDIMTLHCPTCQARLDVTALRDSDAYDLQLVNIKLTEEGDDGDCYYGRGSPEIHDRSLEVDGWHLDDAAEDLPDVIAEVYADDNE